MRSDVIASVVGVGASVVVGAVLVVAGVAKLASPGRWREEATGLGVGAVAPVVPFVEVFVGSAAVAQVRRDVTGWIAAMMFVGFGALLVWHLARGRRPMCSCFGALARHPIGWRAVVRNAVLVVVAVVAASV